VKRNLAQLLSLAHERSEKILAREMASEGLSALAPSHGDVLALLFRKGEATMGELAAFARRSKPTVTVLVDKLESLGFVERGRSAGDARAVPVRLAPAGEALRPAFRAVSRRLCARLSRGLDRDEAATLERLLEKSLSAEDTPVPRPNPKPTPKAKPRKGAHP